MCVTVNIGPADRTATGQHTTGLVFLLLVNQPTDRFLRSSHRSTYNRVSTVTVNMQPTVQPR